MKALRTLRQEVCKSRANLGFIVKSYIKETKTGVEEIAKQPILPAALSEPELSSQHPRCSAHCLI